MCSSAFLASYRQLLGPASINRARKIRANPILATTDNLDAMDDLTPYSPIDTLS